MNATKIEQDNIESVNHIEWDTDSTLISKFLLQRQHGHFQHPNLKIPITKTTRPFSSLWCKTK